MNPEKRELIKRTAAEMGYVRNEAASRLTMKPLRFVIICSHDFPEFDSQLMKGYKEAERMYFAYKLIMTYRDIANESSKKQGAALEAMLREFCENGYDAAIISVCFEGIEPIIKKFSNKIQIALANFDVHDSGRLFATVNDTKAVAKIAAQLLSVNKGKCAVFTGVRKHWTHTSILESFQDAVANTGMSIACVYHSASEEEMHLQVAEAFKEHPDITAIYSTSALSVPICEYINANGLKGKVLVVASDVYERLNEYIIDGTVCATLYQNPTWQTYTAVEMMYKYLAQGVTPCERIVSRPEIVISANLELYTK